jgi:hypothetical protein
VEEFTGLLMDARRALTRIDRKIKQQEKIIVQEKGIQQLSHLLKDVDEAWRAVVGLLVRHVAGKNSDKERIDRARLRDLVDQIAGDICSRINVSGQPTRLPPSSVRVGGQKV